MANLSQQQKLNNLLKLEFSQKNDIWLSNQNTLRKLVGVLGVLLPPALFIFLYIDTQYNNPLESISHYYYTRVSSIFIIIVSLLAIFLIVYKGEKPVDFYISTAAGVFALSLLLFPTSNISSLCCDTSKNYSVTILKQNDFRETFHYVSAGIFLSCLAFMSIRLFTKSDKEIKDRGKEKKIRNRIFRVCGAIMILAMLVIVAGFLKIIPDDFYDKSHLTFWMETVAVESFGVSWLIKGESFFKDKVVNKSSNNLLSIM
jgi:formate hydrogenlyase subunit 3/multisubunit Na+/H+ antiporter MnhD subunit